LALCKHSDKNHIFDVTPVENLFIHEFMLKAPGDFVKVYLFGLMQCYNPDCTQKHYTCLFPGPRPWKYWCWKCLSLLGTTRTTYYCRGCKGWAVHRVSQYKGPTL